MPNVNHRTMIGGQAVIEGVMMRGPRNAAMSVRTPTGEITTESWPTVSVRDRHHIWKLPFLRGIIAFAESLVFGIKCLNRSGEIAGVDEETPKDEKSEEKHGASEKLMMAGAMALGIIIAVGLFIVLPTTVVSLLKTPMLTSGIGAPWLFTLIEGLIRIGLFLAYLAAVSRMKDIQRVFEYHGAEHKSIYCYEHGEELIVENARKYTRLHPRCGTSFLLIVFIVSILVYSFVTWSNPVERIGIHLLLLPLVVGISFEIIHFAGLHDNSFMRFILGPGLLLQKLTTREPDDSQLEVALTSLKAVLTGNREDDKW